MFPIINLCHCIIIYDNKHGTNTAAGVGSNPSNTAAGVGSNPLPSYLVEDR